MQQRTGRDNSELRLGRALELAQPRSNVVVNDECGCAGGGKDNEVANKETKRG
ncbi:MAG: hypothetical protein Q9211_006002 [Gyalolechia sp. 1 TL-2023]